MLKIFGKSIDKYWVLVQNIVEINNKENKYERKRNKQRTLCSNC